MANFLLLLFLLLSVRFFFTAGKRTRRCVVALVVLHRLTGIFEVKKMEFTRIPYLSMEFLYKWDFPTVFMGLGVGLSLLVRQALKF